MSTTDPTRSAFALSIVSMGCAAVASAVTMVWRGSFPDASPGIVNGALAEARGWSGVTLGLVLPLAASALFAARRSIRARLVWLGTLVYLAYTYLELAVSPPFTPLYLVYIAAFACAVGALVIGIRSLDVGTARAALDRTPRRSVAAFALATALFLTLAWTRGIAERTLAGEFGWPVGEAAIAHVVHALDLGLQVPLAIAAGVLLLRRRPAGYAVATIFLTNAACMGAALTAMVAVASEAAGRSATEALPFAAIPIIATALLLGCFRAPRIVLAEAA